MTDSAKCTVVTLPRFEEAGKKVADFLDAELMLYRENIFGDIYGDADCIVAIMSAGIAVRGCAPFLSDKWHDAAVVVVTPDLSYAIPVIGGHHGANDCAKRLAGLGITPVISTATEVMGRKSVEEIAKSENLTVVNRSSTRKVNGAILDSDVPILRVNPPKVIVANPGVSVLVNDSKYVIGIGCRLGTTEDEVISAVREGCKKAGISESDAKIFATTIKKFHEAGLKTAAEKLNANLIFLDDETINSQMPPSKSCAERLGLCGVSEPCATALSREGVLILEKTVFGRVTIAIAK